MKWEEDFLNSVPLDIEIETSEGASTSTVIISKSDRISAHSLLENLTQIQQYEIEKDVEKAEKKKSAKKKKNKSVLDSRIAIPINDPKKSESPEKNIIEANPLNILPPASSAINSNKSSPSTFDQKSNMSNQRNGTTDYVTTIPINNISDFDRLPRSGVGDNLPIENSIKSVNDKSNESNQSHLNNDDINNTPPARQIGHQALPETANLTPTKDTQQPNGPQADSLNISPNISPTTESQSPPVQTAWRRRRNIIRGPKKPNLEVISSETQLETPQQPQNSQIEIENSHQEGEAANAPNKSPEKFESLVTVDQKMTANVFKRQTLSEILNHP